MHCEKNMKLPEELESSEKIAPTEAKQAIAQWWPASHLQAKAMNDDVRKKRLQKKKQAQEQMQSEARACKQEPGVCKFTAKSA